MISPVSFGSTYKFSLNDFSTPKTLTNQNDLMDFCYENAIPAKTEEHFSKRKSGSIKFSLETTAVVPDKQDVDIETFCANRGIDYTKYKTSYLMNPSAIESRIEKPIDAYEKAYVNVDRLYEIISKQDSNLEHCKSDYNNYFKEQLDFMLKSGDEIPATTLCITPYSGNNEMLKYINTFGANNLNYNSLSIDFEQRTKNDPDHAMFFAMMDAGLTEIPVYVDYNSNKLGKALGILQ